MGSLNANRLNLCAVLFAATTFVNPAHAFFGTLDDHMLLLTSSDALEVRHGAESVFDQYGGNRAMLDVAAARLHGSLNATSSDKLPEDTVAWLAKAIGGSGSRRYEPLLTEVKDTGPGKSRSWAKLGLRRISRDDQLWSPLDVDVVAIRAEALRAVPHINTELRQRMQLANYKLVRQTAERAYYLAPYVEPATLDLARGLLSDHHLTGDKELRQALNWVCRLLGRAGNRNDLELLRKVAREGPGKLKGHAREAVEAISTRG